MIKGFFYILSVFTLLSCGGSDGLFMLKGEFTHLQQGEFFIYSSDGGLNRVDTLRIKGGKFEYSTPLNGNATFHILYTNFSEHIIFAKGGDKITIKGDARSLKETRIEGSEDNELYTRFRLDNLNTPLNLMPAKADSFIRQYPKSQVSIFLFKTYFLDGAGKNDPVTQHALYDILVKAQPENAHLIKWQLDLDTQQKIITGKRLPNIAFTTPDSVEIQSTDYRGNYLLITYWATWNPNSVHLLRQTRYWRRRTQGKLAAISYSLDLNRKLRENEERIDTVDWPSHCTYKGWNDTQLQLWGITDIPYSVLTDTNQIVIAQGSNFEKDILPEIKRIFNPK